MISPGLRTGLPLGKSWWYHRRLLSTASKDRRLASLRFFDSFLHLCACFLLGSTTFGGDFMLRLLSITCSGYMPGLKSYLLPRIHLMEPANTSSLPSFLTSPMPYF